MVCVCCVCVCVCVVCGVCVGGVMQGCGMASSMQPRTYKVAHTSTKANAYHIITHSPSTPPCCLLHVQSATGVLALTQANHDLYGTCASTGYRPSGAGGGECTPAEVACYKCYCYEALSAGMFKWVSLAAVSRRRPLAARASISYCMPCGQTLPSVH